jgi:hypothetical protein
MPDQQNQPGNTDDAAILDAMEAMLRLEQDHGYLILMEKLKALANVALNELADVDPGDAKAVRDLQNDVARYRWFRGTVRELIDEGAQILDATETIETEQEEEPHYGTETEN